MISLYEGAKTRIRDDSELSVEFEVAIHQRNVLSPLLFGVVVDVATELPREGALSE